MRKQFGTVFNFANYLYYFRLGSDVGRSIILSVGTAKLVCRVGRKSAKSFKKISYTTSTSVVVKPGGSPQVPILRGENKSHTAHRY